LASVCQFIKTCNCFDRSARVCNADEMASDYCGAHKDLTNKGRSSSYHIKQAMADNAMKKDQ